MENEKKVSKDTQKPEYVSPEAKFFSFDFAAEPVSTSGKDSDDGYEDEL